MKVAHAEKHVLGSHGLSETKGFTIRTNAHAFKLLSSGLYTDKIAAVLREIGCNAADAHVECGFPDKPIQVKLPNRIDNQFYIRDYGPGLSHEQVMNLYTTYFASTKQDSNDYTGAFGLGSKSPFSYTDMFTVVSAHGGKQRTYSAYLDNKGSPTISMLTELPATSDWPHGLQIGFPVKQEDFHTFQQRAQNIYRWFRVHPEILGSTPIQPVLPTFDNALFGYYPGNINGTTLGCVMGNVFYPINTSKLNIASPGYGSRATKLATFINMFRGVVLKVNIGDVEVAASREELSYTPETIKFLITRIEEILRYIGDDIATQLRAAKTWEEKASIRGKVSLWNANTGYGVDWDTFFAALNYSDHLHLTALIQSSQVPAPAIMGVKALAKLVQKRNYGKLNLDTVEITGGKQTNRWGSTSQVYLPLKKTKIYYGKTQLSLVKCKNVLDATAIEQVLLFTVDKAKGYSATDAKDEAEAVAKELGITGVYDLSTVSLPKDYVPSPKRKKKGPTLAPLPSVQVKVVSDKSDVEDISTLKSPFQTFMVRSPRSGWSGTDQIRVYEATADKDRMFDEDTWNKLWANYRIINKKLGGPVDGYVELRAVDVSKLDLVKRGWKTAYDKMKEWLEQQATRDAIIKEAAAWRPSMNLNGTNHSGWGGELVYLKHTNPMQYKKIQHHLEKVGLHKMIEQLHEESLKQGTKAGKKEPELLSCYRELAAHFGLQPISMTNGGTFLTLEDFEQHISDKFKLADRFDYGDLRHIASNHPLKLETFIMLVLS